MVFKTLKKEKTMKRFFKLKNTLFFSGFFVTTLVLLVIGSCSESKMKLPELELKCLYSQLEDMTLLIDTSRVGTEDGTYPKESLEKLIQEREDLKLAVSRALAHDYVLQHQVDKYCIAADKAIGEFLLSKHYTLMPGEPAELHVFGVDRKGYIDFGESEAYGGSSRFTAECWMKYDEDFYDFAIGHFIGTFSHNGKGVKEGWSINFMGSNLRTTLGVGPQEERVFEWGSIYPKKYGQWIHIAAVYDEDATENQLKMYVDGELFFSKTNDVTDSSGEVQKYQPNTRKLKMWGFVEAQDKNRCMTGYMKKFRLWHEPKSKEEIAILMNQEVTGKENNLVCAWDFIEVPENNEEIKDKTGNHTAKLVGLYKWEPLEK